MDLRREHDLWLAQQLEKKNPNPCVNQYGTGPEGKTCRNCRHLFMRRYTRSYWKCSERDYSGHSAASDHRVNWQACAKYEEA